MAQVVECYLANTKSWAQPLVQPKKPQTTWSPIYPGAHFSFHFLRYYWPGMAPLCPVFIWDIGVFFIMDMCLHQLKIFKKYCMKTFILIYWIFGHLFILLAFKVNISLALPCRKGRGRWELIAAALVMDMELDDTSQVYIGALCRLVALELLLAMRILIYWFSLCFLW
jgi:hypothetical protein